MNKVFVLSDTIISPLGFTTHENYNNIRNGLTGIRKIDSPIPLFQELYCSSINDSILEKNFNAISNSPLYTKVEKLLILSILDTIKVKQTILEDKETILIISTTKGNIELLDPKNCDTYPKERLSLWSIANTLQDFFKTKNKPIILSNACISGVNALVMAQRIIQEGSYKSVVVAGVDVLSNFVISGFQSLKAISPLPCRPYDKARDGITLGEACGSILLSSENINQNQNITIVGGSISNDANHISGPSRTGDGLYLAIKNALLEANLEAREIDFINAHGTATIYNDEMESKAFKLAHLEKTPLNSLKGYFGHTLGAAGIIETIISIKSLINNEVLPTIGFENMGTPEHVSVSNQLVQKESHYLLKTASGFGGGNGAIIVSKN